VTLGKIFYNLIFKQETVTDPVTAKFSSIYAFLVEAFIRKLVTLYMIVIQ